MDAEEATVLTSRIEEAGQTLLDADARARYDASLARPGGRLPAGGVVVSPPFATIPPVIPALITPAEEPRPERPADLLQAEPEAAPAHPEAASSAPTSSPVPASPPALAAPAPIRLDREVVPTAASSAAIDSPVVAASPGAEAPAAAASRAPAPEPQIPMPEGAAWTGEAIRRVREARNLTVQQIAERTRVTRHHVENIEADRFSALPAPVYLRGILHSIARELRLDGQKVARAYLARAAGTPPTGSARAR
jgi:hypothetical protein